MVNVVGLGLFAGASLFGVLLAWLGYRGVQTMGGNFLAARRLRSTARTDVSEVTPESGFVEIAGTARVGDAGTIAAPVGETRALVRHEEVDRRTGGDEGRNFDRVDRQFESVPFHVEDETGSARVELPPIDFDELDHGHHRPHLRDPLPSPMLDESSTRTFIPGDSHDEDIESLPVPESIASVFDVAFEDTPYRFSERLLEPGETAYVAGYAEPAPPDSDADVCITGGEHPGHVVVADQSEDAVESGLYLKLLLGTGLAVALVLVGVALVLAGLWVVATRPEQFL